MQTAEELKRAYPENEVILDSRGLPSVMVRIPAFRMCDVVDGASDALHPAFLRNGAPVDAICIGKFQSIVRGGLAYSLPDEDPATHVDFDTAVRASTEKGGGWHLMTALEWGAVALRCMKNGFLPYGNNDMGRDIRESETVARIAYSREDKPVCRTATGTGPASWNHNGKADGISDLNGNVWEWSGGIRLVRGELQLLSDGAHRSAQNAESPFWCAIDGTTGTYLTPDGNGTTKGSVKLDFVDDAWRFVSGEITDSYAHARFCDFTAVRADESVGDGAKELLTALGLLPVGDTALLEGVALYANNGASERMLFRGGRWGQRMNAGLYKACFDDPRTYAGDAVGCRLAYYET